MELRVLESPGRTHTNTKDLRPLRCKAWELGRRWQDRDGEAASSHGSGEVSEKVPRRKEVMSNEMDWRERAERSFLASEIDPTDRRGRKNAYIDLLQKMALEQVLRLRGDETVPDFGCGGGRISYWIAPKVKNVVGLEITGEMIELAEKHRQGKAALAIDPFFPNREETQRLVRVLKGATP